MRPVGPVRPHRPIRSGATGSAVRSFGPVGTLDRGPRGLHAHLRRLRKRGLNIEHRDASGRQQRRKDSQLLHDSSYRL
jgi:hypothetical protein